MAADACAASCLIKRHRGTYCKHRGCSRSPTCHVVGWLTRFDQNQTMEVWSGNIKLDGDGQSTLQGWSLVFLFEIMVLLRENVFILCIMACSFIATKALFYSVVLLH